MVHPLARYAGYTLLVWVWATCQVFSQNIGGVINTYAKVVAITGQQLEVTNVSGNVADFDAGRQVLIIQMKGAQVSTANDATYGSIASVADYRNAGNYELAIVAARMGSGPSYLISLQEPLLRTYDVSGYVQLVSVPRYTNATVVSNITAKPWNRADGTGGIVALDVENVLTLNANIDVSAAGFRGGMPNTVVDASCNNSTLYASNQSRYGQKGEGIAEDIANPFARGRIANGGGGGNTHNAGGGGGANLGSGGDGGIGWTGAGACTGSSIPPGGSGIGGMALSYNAGINKIFMGGGGGAGQQNNNVASRGGHGGGIIILRAGTITTSNCAVSPALLANGEHAPHSTGNDGAGGGGAGGTVLLIANQIQMPCQLKISLNGGNGGNVSHNVAHGGGGGGGSGALLTNIDFSAHIQLMATPGANGFDCNTSACTTSSTSTPGNPCPSGMCSSTGWSIPGAFAPLPVEWMSWQAIYIKHQGAVQLRWQTLREERVDYFFVERSGDLLHVERIGQIKATGNTAELRSYNFMDLAPNRGMNYYRLRVQSQDGVISYSEWLGVRVDTDILWQQARLYPNPATERIHIDWPSELPLRAALYTLDGQQLNHWVPASRQEQLDLSWLKKGIYLLCADYADGRHDRIRLILY